MWTEHWPKLVLFVLQLVVPFQKAINWSAVSTIGGGWLKLNLLQITASTETIGTEAIPKNWTEALRPDVKLKLDSFAEFVAKSF